MFFNIIAIMIIMALATELQDESFLNEVFTIVRGPGND